MIDEKKLYTTVGKLIRNARQKVHLSQDELSDQLGLTRTSVSNFERGKQHIQLHTLYQIAVTLKVPFSELLPEVELVIAKAASSSKEEQEIIQRFLEGGDTRETST